MTLITLVIFFSLMTDVFLTVQNLQNIVTQIAPIAVAAAGVTFVLLCAEIDLCIASLAVFTGVLAAWFWVGTKDLGNWGIPVAILVAAAIGISTATGRLHRHPLVHDDAGDADHRPGARHFVSEASRSSIFPPC